MSSINAICFPDMTITKELASNGQRAVLDADGDIFETFPAEMTNAQIKFCIGLINRYYDQGVRLGELRKANEIKAALGIKNNQVNNG